MSFLDTSFAGLSVVSDPATDPDYPYDSYLKRGSSGDAVLDLQRRLTTVASFSIAVDGKFGPETEGAVIAVQKALGVAVDGVWGPESEKAFAADIDGRGGRAIAAGRAYRYGASALTPRPSSPSSPADEGDYSTPPHDEPSASATPSPFVEKLRELAKKPAFWIALGGGALLLYLLFKSDRRASADEPPLLPAAPVAGVDGPEFFARPKKKRRKKRAKR